MIWADDIGDMSVSYMKMDEKTHKLICECGKIDSRNISSNYGGI